ncbi:MAG TPA: hypothetical protein PKI05_14385 [Thermogutta sp.]|nr:hypothetical protein [Thermogutta sp.]HOP77853.1 hypothetical protein [Thermogutta sp.]HPU06206.1 hypothetical protein [Thermogutta sp.]HPZ82624.1 hypothetical protein [Thermogutta sp.]HQF15280.1 hypothetical protein [Thermogutta sp.]
MTGWDWFLALVPVGIYLIVIGALNLARRPVVMTGMQDRVLLGLATIGLIVVGPVELFLPLPVYVAYGPTVWLIAIVLLTLVIGLLILAAPPKLVIFNASVHEVRSLVSETAVELDPESRWAGDCLHMPNLRVQLFLHVSPGWRNATLSAIGNNQDYQGWHRFGQALTKRLAMLEVRPNLRGLYLLLTGSVLLATCMISAFREPTILSQLLSRIISS